MEIPTKTVQVFLNILSSVFLLCLFSSSERYGVIGATDFVKRSRVCRLVSLNIELLSLTHLLQDIDVLETTMTVR